MALRILGSQRPAVREVAFAVEPGEMFGFLGPSGAGKSTTQNVLIRLLDGYEGNVAVLGKDLRAWDRGYYRHIGVAFEAPNHYLKLTARENLQLFGGLYGGGTEDPDALLERVGLEQDGNKLVAEFSKGMRGRLTFARALLHRPHLLFLDEPTAGLDPVTARRIRQVIRDARQGSRRTTRSSHSSSIVNSRLDRDVPGVSENHCDDGSLASGPRFIATRVTVGSIDGVNRFHEPRTSRPSDVGWRRRNRRPLVPSIA